MCPIWYSRGRLYTGNPSAFHSDLSAGLCEFVSSYCASDGANKVLLNRVCGIQMTKRVLH